MGWALIVIAAMTWGMDDLFRSPLTQANIDPALIVFGEHLALTLCFLPTLISSWSQYKALSVTHRWALIFIAWGASAIATWLYTLAFVYGSPLSAILLQKTQPLFALALAPIFLGEKRHRFFWPLAVVALAGAYLLALGVTSPFDALHGSKFLAASLAICAAALWGMGTVAGRMLSKSLTPMAIAAGRFSLALPLLAAAVLVHPKALATVHVLNVRLSLDWLAVVVIPDILGMTIYYFGIRSTPASIATLGELAYPATALIIGVLFLHQSLNVAQVFGLAILIVAVEQLAARKAVTEKLPEEKLLTTVN